MKSRQFFQLCREMVESRWVCELMRDGEIRVVLRVYLYNEIPTPFPQPICSVANNLLGFSPKSPRDVVKAGDILGLSQEFAHLVIEASGPVGTDSRNQILEVRHELVSSLRPAPLYGPPENSIRAPILEFARQDQN